MEDRGVFIVRVDVQERPGYFYAVSQDLPGLRVCGQTLDETKESVFRGIKALFLHNQQMDVAIYPVSDSIAQFPAHSHNINRLAVLPC